MRVKHPPTKYRYVNAEERVGGNHLFKSKGQVSIAKALIENAALPEARQRTQVQISKDLGVAESSVHQTASRLRKRGRLRSSDRQTTNAVAPSAGRSPRSAPGGLSLPDSLTPEALQKAYSGDFSGIEVLDAEKRRRGLSFLAQTAPPAVQVQAHKALEDMERSQGVMVGPPPPQSDDEVTARLAALLGAAGPKLSFAAMKVAFPEVAK